MGVVTIGMFSSVSQSILGSVFLMVSHGIVSGALFLCIGFLYQRHHTRIVKYFSGLLTTMPLYSTFFVIFTLANIGLPGTSSFIGEFLILVGTFQTNTWIATLAATGMILGGAYSIWLYNRVVFGNFKPAYIDCFADVNRREFWMFVPFVIAILWMGVYPQVFLEPMHMSVANVIQHGAYV